MTQAAGRQLLHQKEAHRAVPSYGRPHAQVSVRGPQTTVHTTPAYLCYSTDRHGDRQKVRIPPGGSDPLARISVLLYGAAKSGGPSTEVQSPETQSRQRYMHREASNGQ